MASTTKDEIRLHEGELNVMELLWSNSVLAAKDIAKIIKEYIGWEKNTTYTVIKRLIDKGAVSREDPGFLCRALISKREVQRIERLCSQRCSIIRSAFLFRIIWDRESLRRKK